MEPKYDRKHGKPGQSLAVAEYVIDSNSDGFLGPAIGHTY